MSFIIMQQEKVKLFFLCRLLVGWVRNRSGRFTDKSFIQQASNPFVWGACFWKLIQALATENCGWKKNDGPRTSKNVRNCKIQMCDNFFRVLSSKSQLLPNDVPQILILDEKTDWRPWEKVFWTSEQNNSAHDNNFLWSVSF